MGARPNRWLIIVSPTERLQRKARKRRVAVFRKVLGAMQGATPPELAQADTWAPLIDGDDVAVPLQGKKACKRTLTRIIDVKGLDLGYGRDSGESGE